MTNFVISGSGDFGIAVQRNKKSQNLKITQPAVLTLRYDAA